MEKKSERTKNSSVESTDTKEMTSQPEGNQLLDKDTHAKSDSQHVKVSKEDEIGNNLVSKSESKSSDLVKNKDDTQNELENKETVHKEKKEVVGQKPKSNSIVKEQTLDDDEDIFDDQPLENKFEDIERKKLEKIYADTVTLINEHELITGTVVSTTERDAIISIKHKSDGLVSLSEFRDMDHLAVGDEVEVYIEAQEDKTGKLVLSRKKAKILKAWDTIQKALDNDIILEGLVKRRTRGGLILDVLGIEVFLPGSQIDVKPIRDFDIYLEQTMEVKVVKINYNNDNVVVSHKALIEKDIEEQKALIINNLEKGQVLEGNVKNMTSFGVFVDLGGVDGLLHITDISWKRINHPEDVLNLDEKINVVVLDFDDNKQRISLGLKQLIEHPWNALDPSIIDGSKVKGTIVNVTDYGAFLELLPGVEGLIHVSEMSWSQHLRNPSDFINVGDEIDAVVITLDREEKKMSLGIKQLTEDPWTKQETLTKYSVGTEHDGMVRNLTSFGLFIELEEGIDGLVHVSDLSWTKKIKHPSEFVKVDDPLSVKVMELDVENRRVALSHKHLEEDPWDTFESIFTKGSVHKCTIVHVSDKIAFLEIPYGLEGQSLLKNLKKEDGNYAKEGDTLEFKVIDFSKNYKRILMSHTAVWIQPEAKKPQNVSESKASPKTNKENEKSTLGDLDSFSSLKEKFNKKELSQTKTEKPTDKSTQKTQDTDLIKENLKPKESEEKIDVEDKAPSKKASKSGDKTVVSSAEKVKTSPASKTTSKETAKSNDKTVVSSVEKVKTSLSPASKTPSKKTSKSDDKTVASSVEKVKTSPASKTPSKKISKSDDKTVASSTEKVKTSAANKTTSKKAAKSDDKTGVSSAEKVKTSAANKTTSKKSAKSDDKTGVSSAEKVKTSAASKTTSKKTSKSDDKTGVSSVEKVKTSAASKTISKKTAKSEKSDKKTTE